MQHAATIIADCLALYVVIISIGCIVDLAKDHGSRPSWKGAIALFVIIALTIVAVAVAANLYHFGYWTPKWSLQILHHA